VPRRTLTFVAIALLLSATSACQEYELSPLPGNYVGKVFYSVDLNNYDGDATNSSADAAPYTLTISNPANNQERATVEVQQLGGEELYIKETIEPGTLETFDMPRWDAEDSFLGNRSVNVTSSVAVAIHQFNPANNVGVYSNDASLLLPRVALGTRYRAACWPQGTYPELLGAADYVTVVATAADTTVTVTPTADIRAGLSVPATTAGTPLLVTLDAGEVLQIEGDNAASGVSDLTGSLIEASAAVVVFSGNECAMVPADVWACDHIEEQLHPIEAWGEHYFVVKFEPRGSEADIFRVIADEDGTEVSTEPELPGFPVTLDGGDFIEFESDGEFEVKSSDPVSLIQYMSGSEYTNVPLGSGIGDPAMLVVVPNEQFVDEFIFLTPEGYLEGWITVVAGNNSEVTLDDDPIDDGEWNEFPSGDKRWARIAVEPGVHRLHSDQPMGLTVYGYDDDVSYAYPGGAQLTPQAY